MKDSYAHSPLIARKGFRFSLTAISIVAIVTIARSIWVSLYGADIPFWDQWIQVSMQLVPLKQGTWHFSDYWAPHNEHRILFTRLISMALFELGGGIWSNLTEAYLNTAIYAGTLAFFYVMACRGTDRLFQWITFLAIVALGMLPYDWENTLVGFQNQFYIMLTFTIALAGIACYRRPESSTFWILVAISVISLFTMASGLFGTIAVCTVIVLRSWRDNLSKTYVLATLTAMALVAIGGILLIPAAPGNDIYKAHGLADHLHALAAVLIWPMQSLASKHSLRALLLWTPTVLWLINFFRTRRAKDSEIFLIGVVAWVLCQAVAIAHSRGHDMNSIPPRYSNITTLGLLSNFALALHLAQAQQSRKIAKYLSWATIILGVGAVIVIFSKRTNDDMDAMQQRYDFSRMETFYTHAYLTTKNPAFLQHPSLTIPFPSPQVLQGFLDSTVVEGLLPPTLQKTEASPIQGVTGAGWLANMALRMQWAVQQGLVNVGVNTPSIFFQALPLDSTTGMEAPPIGLCSDTNVNDTEVTTGPLHAKAGGPIWFNGWVINPDSRVTKRFLLTLVGRVRYAIEVKPGTSRKDVVNAQHSNPRDTYGFRSYGVLLDVLPDSYTIRLTTLGSHGRTICELPYKLMVAPESVEPLSK